MFYLEYSPKNYKDVAEADRLKKKAEERRQLADLEKLLEPTPAPKETPVENNLIDFSSGSAETNSEHLSDSTSVSPEPLTSTEELQIGDQGVGGEQRGKLAKLKSLSDRMKKGKKITILLS